MKPFAPTRLWFNHNPHLAAIIARYLIIDNAAIIRVDELISVDEGECATSAAADIIAAGISDAAAAAQISAVAALITRFTAVEGAARAAVAATAILIRAGRLQVG